MNASQFGMTFAVSAAVETGHPRTREDVLGLLLSQLRVHYGDVRDIRGASLSDLWRMARDLVAAIEEWSQVLLHLPGAKKMELALDVA